jgi:hypothetical protein
MSDQIVTSDSPSTQVETPTQENVANPAPAAADLKQEIKDAVADGATKEEIQQMIEEYEIVVNGKNKKVKFDKNNKSEVKRALQLMYAGQSAMQDKAELEKMVTSELLKAKQDPWAFLQDQLGLDPDELLENRAKQKLEEMRKSPEQLEKERSMKELEEARKKLKEMETEKENEKNLRMQNAAASELNSEITEALQQDKELPKTKKTVRRIADMMIWAMDNGFENVKVSDVLPAVKKEIQDEFREFVSELPEELMENYIGKNAIEKLRKRRLAAQKQSPQTVDVRPPAPAKVEEKAKEKIAARDYFRKLSRGEV